MPDNTITSSVTLQNEMYFNGSLDGFTVPLDADPDFGGQHKGPKPKGMVLTALCGCTAMDVISILRKMRVDVSSLEVSASAEVADTHPKIFTSIHLVYKVGGTDISLKKVEKAVSLSKESYCAVSAMLSKSAPIDYTIEIV
jgi:putative redox protein